LSTSEQIREVFEADILDKSMQVYRKKGFLPFLDSNGISVERVFNDIIDEDDLKFLDDIERGVND